jgi:hypothetical protein
MSLLKAFDQWSTKRNADRAGLLNLDNSVKLRAFAFLIREPVPFPHGVDLLSNCYHLFQLTDPAPFLTLVHQVLEKKDYLKV